MKKLLYISYLFPPVGGSGVQRSLKFVKYLPEYGWESIVLTANHRFLNQPKDFSLSLELPNNQVIYNSFAPDLRWLFKLLWGLRLHKIVSFLQRCILIPDPEIIWLPFAKLTLKRIFDEHKIDFVLITSPPYAPLFLGEYVKKRYGVDYCIDFRDPWTSGVGRLYNTPPAWIGKIEKKWEKRIISQAKSIVCVNEAMVEELHKDYPEIPDTKLHSVNNGYDEEDFRDNVSSETNGNKLRLVYTGAFYDLRQPDIVWQAISELVTDGRIDKNKISIEVFGKNNPLFVLGSFQNNSLIKAIVQTKQYVSHSKSVHEILKADLLLLFSGSGSSERMNSPAKLYEYMRSAKPIFAIIDPLGIAAKILAPAETCVIADSSSVEAIKTAFSLLYEKWENGNLAYSPNWDYIKSFERHKLTAKLANLLAISRV